MLRRYLSVARKELKPRAGDGSHRISEVLKELLNVASAGDVEDSFHAGHPNMEI